MPTGSPDSAPPARPTSKDVARAAGVSQAAVSLALGGKGRGRVAPATAERIRRAALDLGYRPNLAARNLRLGRTRTALLVVPALTNEFFAGVYTGAARLAADHDFGLVLYPSPQGVGRARDPFGSARAALDGVIASSMAAQALTAIHGDALPLVMLDSDPQEGPGAATVNLDLADGMRQIAAHLLDLGHRHFLHLAADVDSWTFHSRARALREALAERSGTSVRTVRAPLSIEAARDAAERGLEGAGAREAGWRPTAVVCDDDIMAAGACKAARRLGLSVPGDLSVTGFDDLTLAAALDPELTTVGLPAEEFGARGMAALLALLAGERPDTAPLPVRLVARGSTAAAGR